MKRIAITTAFALLGSVALAQTASERLGVNSALGIAPTTQDFVSEAARSGQFEIQSSELAKTKASDPGTKSFADEMIADHRKADAALKDLVKSKNINVTIPTDLSSSQQSDLDQLKRLSGADFDRQYRDDQYNGHKEAVSLFQRYAKGGDNPDLKKWAEQTAPTLEHHLQMARDLDNKQGSK